MQTLYDIGIQFYYILISFSSLFNKKAKLWLNGRNNLISIIKKKLDNKTETRIWFHCASLGEFEQGRPLIEKIKNECPDLKIVLTFFSPSGYELRKDFDKADYVFYLPLDTFKNSYEFVNIVNPKFAVFVKYEFWYHYLITLKKENIPAFLISAKFRNNQVFFKWYGSFFLTLLKNSFRQIFIQDEQSYTLLNKFNVERTTIANDTRFDRVITIAQKNKIIPIIELFKNQKRIFVFGSTWQNDETIILKFIQKHINNSSLKFIIAPHEIDHSKIEQLKTLFGDVAIKFSTATSENVIDKKIILMDNIGMLSILYKYAHFAYIGGGFDNGIHNILEAAVFGTPLFYGPNYKKFNEAVDLIKMNGAFVINNLTDFNKRFEKIDTNEPLYKITSENNKNYVKSKSGGTNQIFNYLKKEGLLS